MINEYLFSEFCDLVKNDIDFLICIINQKYPKFIQFIRNSNNKSSIKIDFSLFKKLIEEYCYKNIEHATHLFQKIFLKDIMSIIYSPHENTIALMEIYPLNLYYSLFYILFHEKFFKNIKIQDFLEKIILEWKDMIKNHKISTICELDISGAAIEENYTSSKKYHIIKDNCTKIDSLNPFIYYTNNTTKLVIYIQTPITLVKKENRKVKKKHQWQLLLEASSLYRNVEEEFRKILVALFLEGIKIPMIKPQFKFPWFINQNKLIFKDKKNYSRLFSELKISKKNYEDSLNNLKLFLSKDFFNDKCYPFCNHLFKLAVEKREFVDWLFDFHIILEYLFAPGKSGELGFRIALNISYFISEDIEDFKKNFHFFKNIYSLRSIAIHGGDWKNILPKILNKLKQFNIIINTHEELKEYVEFKIIKIILNLINQKLTLPQFKKEIEKNPLFFIENSKIIKK
ncbi:MAG: hypothetical protein ACTSQP_21205 [Promethearchaeota archaeon]